MVTYAAADLLYHEQIIVLTIFVGLAVVGLVKFELKLYQGFARGWSQRSFDLDLMPSYGEASGKVTYPLRLGPLVATILFNVMLIGIGMYLYESSGLHIILHL